MKKIKVLGLVLMSYSVSVAQTDAKFGLKGGLNLATTTNSDGGSRDVKAGIHLGGLAHIHLSTAFALQPEVVYSSQGAKYTTPSGIEHRLNLNYVNIPVLVQYMFNNGFRLQTGPQVGVLVDVNDKVDGEETNVFTSDDFKTTDVSWSFGLGYLGHSGFGVDGRYNLGITNINDNPNFTGKVRNSVFQIGVFYLLDHTHKRKSR